MVTGKVKWFNTIEVLVLLPLKGQQAIAVHVTGTPKSRIDKLVDGQRVSFDIEKTTEKLLQ